MNLYDADPTLLDLLVLPEQIAKDDLIGRMMIDIGESEVCITDPRIMKLAIGAWSRGRLNIWQRLADVMDLEYNPIWNVDGETTHSGNVTGSRTYGRNSTDTETERYSRDRTLDETEETAGSRDLETSRNETTQETAEKTRNEETTGQIAADNVESWSNDTKTVTAETDSTETEASTHATGTEEESTSGTRETGVSEKISDTRSVNGTGTIADTEENEGSDSWTERRTGNIGVTTTQKMMTEEVEFWKNYDIISYIIHQFASEFCLLVY